MASLCLCSANPSQLQIVLIFLIHFKPRSNAFVTNLINSCSSTIQAKLGAVCCLIYLVGRLILWMYFRASDNKG